SGHERQEQKRRKEHQMHCHLHHISATGAKRDRAHHESQSRHREVRDSFTETRWPRPVALSTSLPVPSHNVTRWPRWVVATASPFGRMASCSIFAALAPNSRNLAPVCASKIRTTESSASTWNLATGRNVRTRWVELEPMSAEESKP